MKKIIAALPSHYDWSGAMEDGLKFGVTAAVFIRIVPVISRAVLAGLGRAGGSLRPNGALLSPSAKIFGQRR